MWTLILVTFVVSGISTGGVGTTTAFLDFPSEAKCQAAAAALAGADQINPSRGNHPDVLAFGDLSDHCPLRRALKPGIIACAPASPRRSPADCGEYRQAAGAGESAAVFRSDRRASAAVAAAMTPRSVPPQLGGFIYI